MEKMYLQSRVEPSIDEGGDVEINLKDFDIVHLFGKEKLEAIQERISKVTGLAFVTVDFKGQPVTESTYFTEFCDCVRKNKLTEQGCWSSDAYGAVQATITKKPSIYFCPCGLLEVAIPLIVRGHYLGGFIGGQVWCEDAPANVVRLENILGQPDLLKESGIDIELRKKASKHTYEQFCNIADLAAMIINQMTETELTKLERTHSDSGKVEELEREIQNLKYQIRQKDTQISNITHINNGRFILNTLTSIANLSVIEDATETNEALMVCIEYIQSMMKAKTNVWPLMEELDNVERYLKIQKMRYEERLNYSIEVSEKLRMQHIPANTLQPFVQQAVEHGVALKEEGGAVRISVQYVDDDVVIFVEDEGPGINNDKLEKFFGHFDEGIYSDGILQSVEAASKRMRLLFGKQYDVVTEVVENRGRRACIRYPRYFDEGVVADVPDSNSR